MNAARPLVAATLAAALALAPRAARADGGWSFERAAAPAPAPRYVPRDLGAHEDLEPARKGLVLELGMMAVAPTGAIASGVDTPSAAPGAELRAGWFFTHHYGLVVGVEGSRGHHVAGCAESACGGTTLAFPVVFQYALDTPHRGAYLELGASLLPRYALSAPGVSLVATAPLDLRTGVGWRVPVGRHAAVDLFVRSETGMFTSVTVTSAGASTGGDLDPSGTAWHETLSLGASFELLP